MTWTKSMALMTHIVIDSHHKWVETISFWEYMCMITLDGVTGIGMCFRGHICHWLLNIFVRKHQNDFTGIRICLERVYGLYHQLACLKSQSQAIRLWLLSELYQVQLDFDMHQHMRTSSSNLKLEPTIGALQLHINIEQLLHPDPWLPENER
jgi:hypothetical protein